MPITLTVIAGPHTGQVFTFTGHDRFLVGRSNKAHFRLKPDKQKDLRVSRLHFLVEVNPPLCRLHDIGSRNGTHVNGQRVTSCDLKHADEIRAGRTVLRVALEEEPLPPTLAWVAGPGPESLPSAPTVAMVGPPLGPTATGGPPVVTGSGLVCVGCGVHHTGVGGPACPVCLRQAAAQPQPIPGYLLLRELGRGGMGLVHLALHQPTQVPVALKTIVPGGAARPGQVERFLREAEILRELDHPHVVAFRDLGAAEGQLYFVMDYVAGTDAGRLLRQCGPLDVRSAVRIALQVLKALEYAHGRRFVHRDIKPANVLLEISEGRTVVKVSDFGLARVYQASQVSGLTLQNELGGTVGFMAPEQITRFRDVQPAADQYSAAATVYNLLTGELVYDLGGHLIEQLDKILKEDVVPIRARRGDLPGRLADAIHRALAREPDDRFPDVTSFREALRPFAH